jgi:hypothetical protein
VLADETGGASEGKQHGHEPFIYLATLLQRLSKLIPMSFAIFRLHRTRLFAPDRFARN